jgi:DNA-binding CsgD family transcriptional regulator
MHTESNESYELSKLPELARLSPRQTDVVEHLKTKLTEKEIAQLLRVNRHSIHADITAIYRKLRVSGRKDLQALLAGRPTIHKDALMRKPPSST